MQLEAQWVVGFVDGQGCFHVGINVHPEMSAGHQVLPEFTVVRHERDIQVLHALKAFFKCGVVRRNHAQQMAYRVRSREHLLQKIVPFFMTHPLKTKRNIDFLKFRDVLLLMEHDKHLTREGVDSIRAIANQMSTCQINTSQINTGEINTGEVNAGEVNKGVSR